MKCDICLKEKDTCVQGWLCDAKTMKSDNVCYECRLEYVTGMR